MNNKHIRIALGIVLAFIPVALFLANLNFGYFTLTGKVIENIPETRTFGKGFIVGIIFSAVILATLFRELTEEDEIEEDLKV